MRIGIVTLGCDKNTVDNEYLAGLLDEAGCEVLSIDSSAPPPDLDAAVVTTCGFIDRAKAQSVESIVELAEAKRIGGNPRRLFVAGCLSQRNGEELSREIPEIDGLVGVGQWTRLAEMILNADDRARRWMELAATPTVDIYRLMRRKPLEKTPHAFLKISDGCNHTCTFCSIPSMKGKLRSVPKEIVLDEARALLDRGVREINLVAQDLSMYGMDRWEDYRLPDLIRDLAALPGDFWIRCLYYYPGLVTDAFLDVLAGEPKVVKYLDMPLQHLDPGVLRRMRRPFHEVKTFRLIDRMRERVPGLTLRTTMIVGFPDETEAEHAAMVDGIEQLRFERLGAFPYSEEDGTPAGTMQGQVPKKERERRWHAVMRAQQTIAEAHGRRRVGRRERVLIEGHDPERGVWFGRGAGEAPEIDGKVFVEAEAPPTVGEFVEVEITGATTYDVRARPVVAAAV
jgi:ribosomal protein S12 methylthiotransferase